MLAKAEREREEEEDRRGKSDSGPAVTFVVAKQRRERAQDPSGVCHHLKGRVRKEFETLLEACICIQRLCSYSEGGFIHRVPKYVMSETTLHLNVI